MSCYGLAAEFQASRTLGVLGAAKYVVAQRIERMALAGSRETARATALDLISRSPVLEPSHDELDFAAAIETAAQRRGLELDAGESQLAAIVVSRDIGRLETGDKRAIQSFDALLDDLSDLQPLSGRLRCLEQIIVSCLQTVDPDLLARAVCSEPHVDKALSICFRCYSPQPYSATLDADGLSSYITALRTCAPRMLEP